MWWSKSKSRGQALATVLHTADFGNRNVQRLMYQGLDRLWRDPNTLAVIGGPSLVLWSDVDLIVEREKQNREKWGRPELFLKSSYLCSF